MKTAEQVLTEHVVDEIKFDFGTDYVKYSACSAGDFRRLADYIKLFAHEYEARPNPPTALIAALWDSLRSEFSNLRIALGIMQWTSAQKAAWFDAFCHPDNLSYYESKDEMVAALRWFYVRTIQATQKKCSVPAPSDWLTQSKIAAAREIAEFAK